MPGLKLPAGVELATDAGVAEVGLLAAIGIGLAPNAGLDPVAVLAEVGLGLLPALGAAATPGQRPHEVWQYPPAGAPA